MPHAEPKTTKWWQALIGYLCVPFVLLSKEGWSAFMKGFRND